MVKTLLATLAMMTYTTEAINIDSSVLSSLFGDEDKDLLPVPPPCFDVECGCACDDEACKEQCQKSNLNLAAQIV